MQLIDSTSSILLTEAIGNRYARNKYAQRSGPSLVSVPLLYVFQSSFKTPYGFRYGGAVGSEPKASFLWR